ncbi:hypothetical protein GRS48_03035 [Halorubrum sp. JWXQ-INN 858]|uniref:hypothetical protein n=1 Tax=Halorubrum sp. JWXQ-INN 858 TaxID=2690782 RepID=UPI00135A055B|nr:hypothetical protein [Halorubrum sp. JWXQ-INN 858]MWV63802.1 hypothetical protein [Halorubrum sp. JWXQ-INN 858]
MTGDESAAGVEPTLRSYGISVESLDGGEPLELTYMTAFPGREVHRREIGRALNALLDRADAGAWDPVRVEATVVRSPGDPLGTWTAEGDWFEALIDDDLTETAFSTRVLHTVSHVDAEDDTNDDGPEGGPNEDGPDDGPSDDREVSDA